MSIECLYVLRNNTLKAYQSLKKFKDYKMNIINLASSHGSTAKTAAGALKFLEKNSINLFADLKENYPYKKSNSHWAGGDHSTKVKFSDTPSCSGGSDKVWSKNGKWSGLDSYAILSITRRAYVALDGNLMIGGLITLDAEKVGNREYKAVWAEQSRGFDLKAVEGWIIKGYHVTGGTIEAARKKVAKARILGVEQALITREKKNNKRAEFKPLKTVWVSIEDSLKAGNCLPGTEAAARVVREKLGNISAVRADVLLSIRDDYHTRKAVQAAQNR